METKLSDLKVEAQNIGMKINSQKTKEKTLKIKRDYTLEVMKSRKLANSPIWDVWFPSMEVLTKM
jgi:hypothetical protein